MSHDADGAWHKCWVESERQGEKEREMSLLTAVRVVLECFNWVGAAGLNCFCQCTLVPPVPSPGFNV